MSEVKATKEMIGTSCVFVDSLGKRFPALITNIWGPECINLLYVVEDEKQTDTYGRKTAHMTSLMHSSVQQAHGNYWFVPDAQGNDPDRDHQDA